MGFRPAVGEIAFTLDAIAGLGPAIGDGHFGDLSIETIQEILVEAGRFTSEELAPLNRIGDTVGTRLRDGEVSTPPGWKEAYKHWTAAGWSSVSAPVEWGGQALPVTLNAALNDLWNSGSAAFAVGPMLTAGAVDAIAAHASTALKRIYLPKLVSGEWMGTMNLTEPQAGSDLSALRARAERAGDGTYRVFGQKIFITYGEHDLTDNIIHMVLARLPDAPPGTGGISLFLVPKILVNDDGSLGARNDVICAGIEHKLGLHGSPTCTMIYGDGGEGAVGWLVGDEHRGLAAMFTMMNIARLTVGIQGVGVAARAFDQALAYAHERRQGRAPGEAKGAMSPIILHPDVQRDLLRMKALTAAARALCYSCAFAIDMSHRGPDAARSTWADRAGLLTPIAKAFATDAGIEVASIGIQVHGGSGYIEETGAAQHLRDARIFAIYEGTNGIQAIDLVIRKLRLANGAAVQRLIDELDTIAGTAAKSNRPNLGRMSEHLVQAIEHLRSATAYLAEALGDDREADVLAGATPYLRLFGLAAGGCFLAKGALKANVETDPVWAPLARYFAETMLDEVAALDAAITGGGEAHRAAVRILTRGGEPAA